MKLIMLVLLLVSCKPDQEAPDFGTMIKPLAGPGDRFETKEDTPVRISYQVDEENNPKAVDLTWSMIKAPSHGTLSDCDKQKLSLSCLYTPDENFNGEDSIIIKSVDGDFLSEENSIVKINITPVADAPIVDAKQDFGLPENSELKFEIDLPQDVDSSEFDFVINQESELQGEVLCESSKCTYIPKTDFYGETSFTYKAKDETGLESINSGEVIFTVWNYPEVGESQIIELYQNSMKSFSINPALDHDSENLNYVITSNPSNGILNNCFELVANQLSCEYTPRLGYLGVDQFSYKVIDETSLESEEATVVFNIQRFNNKPMVGQNSMLETLEETAITFEVNAGTDTDNRIIGQEANLNYIVEIAPTKGTLTNCFEGLKNRTCTYNPNPGTYETTDTFTYYVVDEMGARSDLAATVSIFIEKKNRIPKVGADQDLETLEEEPLLITVNAGTDEDHTDPATDAELKYIIKDMPANGTLTNCFNAAEDFTDGFAKLEDRQCTYTPNANFYDQDDQFTYIVMDKEAQSVNFATVKIRVIKKNRIPKVGEDQTFETYEIEPITVTVSAGTDDDHMDADTDAELKYIIKDMPANGTLTNCFNAAEDFSDGFGKEDDRKCTYTANANFYDQDDKFTYIVMDQQDQSINFATVTIKVLKRNIIPKVGADQRFETLEEEEITVNVSPGTDEDHMDPNTAAELKYIIKDQPAYGTLTNCFNADEDFTDGFGKDEDRNCTYTPDADFYDQDDQFTYFVMDEKDQSVNFATVTIRVIKKNRIPKVGDNQQLEVYDDESLTFVASVGTDEDHMDPATVAELKYILNDGMPVTHGTLSNCFNATEDFTDGFGQESDRTCTYTPTAGEYGNTDVIYYYVMDQEDQSLNMATVSILIKQRNDKPTVGEDQTEKGYINLPLAFEVNEGMDTETPKEDLKYVIGNEPTYGELSDDCFTQTKPNHRKCTYTPDQDWKGTDTMTYYILDGNEAQSVNMATVTFDITDKPVDYAKSNCQKAIDAGNLQTMSTKILFQQKKDNDGNPMGCAYGQNGNLDAENGVVTAREEYNKTVEIPDGATLCDADFVFFPDENGNAKEVDFTYDDELLLTLNGYILMMTTDYSTNSDYQQYKDFGLAPNNEGLVPYRWLTEDMDYGMRGLDYVQNNEKYCLGIPRNADNFTTDCVIPNTDTNGSMKLLIPTDEIIKVGALTIDPKPNEVAENENLDFGFIATGDDNPDCAFTDFEFDVTIKYAPKATE